MATCKTCAMNTGGYCMVFDAGIPREREAVEHDCGEWREPVFENADDAVAYIDGLMSQYPDKQALLWTLRDMVSGESCPPAAWTAAAWRFLWTWPEFSERERVEIASWVIPF
jgi:hypothetical protein